MSHFIERCRSCGTVTAQCRCPSTEKSQTFTVCKACLEKGLPYTNCTICFGANVGVRGNEVIHNGVVMCDYCYAFIIGNQTMIENPKMIYKLFEQTTHSDNRETYTAFKLIAVANTAKELYERLVFDKCLKITYTIDDGARPK